MLEVKKLGPILEPTNLDFENLAVLNPGTFQDGEFVHMFYRAIDDKYQSSIGYAKLRGPTEIVERWEKPILFREYIYESKGLEDPRIVKIGDIFYMTYVAHDGKNAITAYATSSDLKTFKKNGMISPNMKYSEVESILGKSESRLKDTYFLFADFYEQNEGNDVLLWHKDVIFFPRKINGKFAMMHRVIPDIQIVLFDSLEDLQSREFWENYLKNLAKYVVLENKHWFESRNIGGGCVPIETDAGWILIFHAVEETNKGRVYHACAALLNKDNPLKVIGRLHEPLFSPTEEWEKSGFVSNVVFPTGSAIFGDTLYIYYGAADKRIAVASVSINELIKEMVDVSKGHNHGKETIS